MIARDKAQEKILIMKKDTGQRITQPEKEKTRSKN